MSKAVPVEIALKALKTIVIAFGIDIDIGIGIQLTVNWLPNGIQKMIAYKLN